MHRHPLNFHLTSWGRRVNLEVPRIERWSGLSHSLTAGPWASTFLSQDLYLALLKMESTKQTALYLPPRALVGVKGAVKPQVWRALEEAGPARLKESGEVPRWQLPLPRSLGPGKEPPTCPSLIKSCRRLVSWADHQEASDPGNALPQTQTQKRCWPRR